MMPGPAPHFIQLGDGKRVRVADYVAGIRLAKANPDRTFKHGLGGWWPETGREILAAYRRHVDTVINRRAGITDDGMGPSERRNAAWLLLCARIAAGLVIRKCKWCGGSFTPRNVNDRWCEQSCARAYLS